MAICSEVGGVPAASSSVPNGAAVPGRSVEELTEIVVAEYRKALEERHRTAAS